jgi:ligand-binding sensor domain-containing protein
LSILSVLSGQKYPFTEYTVRDGLPHNQVSQITQDSRGFLWIVTKNGISRFDGVEFRNYFRKDGLLSNVNNNIFEDNAGNVWVLASNGLSKYDGYRFESYICPGV